MSVKNVFAAGIQQCWCQTQKTQLVSCLLFGFSLTGQTIQRLSVVLRVPVNVQQGNRLKHNSFIIGQFKKASRSNVSTVPVKHN